MTLAAVGLVLTMSALFAALSRLKTTDWTGSTGTAFRLAHSSCSVPDDNRQGAALPATASRLSVVASCGAVASMHGYLDLA